MEEDSGSQIHGGLGVRGSQINVSIIWKDLVVTFSLFSKWLAWKIGIGCKVQVGLDPWIASGKIFRRLDHMIIYLHTKGICNLSMSRIENLLNMTIWIQG